MQPTTMVGEMAAFFKVLRRAFSYETDVMPSRGVELTPFTIAYTPEQISHVFDAGAQKSPDAS